MADAPACEDASAAQRAASAASASEGVPEAEAEAEPQSTDSAEPPDGVPTPKASCAAAPVAFLQFTAKSAMSPTAEVASAGCSGE